MNLPAEPDLPGGALRVGAAHAVLTPPAGLAMAGYAARERPAEGVLDDLTCHAVVFADGVTTLALAVCDLLYVTEELRDRVRRRLADRLDLPAEHVMLTATHTHCGPSGLAGADGGLLDRLAEGVCLAVEFAHADAVPARLATGRASVPGIGRNRRGGTGPLDDGVYVLAALPADGPGHEAIAVVLNHACHPTVLEHDTRAWSPDYPGAARRTLAALTGGEAVFLQGCAGDVNPVYVEHTARDCERLGRILGAGAAQVALRLSRLGRGPRAIDLSWGEELPASTTPGERLVSPTPLRAVVREVEARARARPALDAVLAEQADVRTELATCTERDRRRALSTREAELWIEQLYATDARIRADVDLPGVEGRRLGVQAFRLGAGLSLVALPGEPFTDVGLGIRAGYDGDLLVAGYANQSASYLPTREEFARGGYEPGCASYAPGTAERLVEAADVALDDLTGS